MKPLDLNQLPGTTTGVYIRAGFLFHAQSSFLLQNEKPSRRRLSRQRAVKAAGY
jgi:hypothetical protein